MGHRHHGIGSPYHVTIRQPQFHFDFFHPVRKRIEAESARLEERPQAVYRPQAHPAGVIVKHRFQGGIRCFGNFSHKRKFQAKKGGQSPVRPSRLNTLSPSFMALRRRPEGILLTLSNHPFVISKKASRSFKR